MKVTKLTAFPKNENPFWHDSYHMGTQIGKNVTVMMPNFSKDECKYLIVINTETGERIKVDFNPDPWYIVLRRKVNIYLYDLKYKYFGLK